MVKGKLVTVFGGGGFVGRYLARHLLEQGARLRIVQRDPRQAYFIKPMGNLGQVQFASADVCKAESVARAVQGSDIVINLVGILKGAFHAVHAEGAENVARASAEAGVPALIHMSAIGADSESPSAYGRSKGDGEALVKRAFPAVNIVRPSIIFGPEDQFINRFAAMINMSPVIPIISGDTKFQPVYVEDVARAIANVAEQSAAFKGRTFELGGPQIISMSELHSWIAKMTNHNPLFVTVPALAAKYLAITTGWFPGAPISFDQYKMLQNDNIMSGEKAGLDALGVSATPMAAVAPNWLDPYRKHGRFGTKAKIG